MSTHGLTRRDVHWSIVGNSRNNGGKVLQEGNDRVNGGTAMQPNVPELSKRMSKISLALTGKDA